MVTLLVLKDVFGSRRVAIDAPRGHTFVVAYSNGKSTVIGSRNFDDFIWLLALQMQSCPLAGKGRFFPLNDVVGGRGITTTDFIVGI